MTLRIDASKEINDEMNEKKMTLRNGRISANKTKRTEHNTRVKRQKRKGEGR
jgi:hypothetical protein